MKNPDYRDTMYVTDLAVPNTVNTMPEKTMQAFADHGEVEGDQVTTKYAEAQQVMDDLAKVGIDYDDVIETLEREGVEKFVASWDELVDDGQGPAGVAEVSETLEVAATGAAAEAIRTHVPALVDDGFAGKLFAQDATLWGPDGRGGVREAALLGRPAPHLAAPGRRGLRAPQRAPGARASTTSCSAAWAARPSRPR